MKTSARIAERLRSLGFTVVRDPERTNASRASMVNGAWSWSADVIGPDRPYLTVTIGAYVAMSICLSVPVEYWGITRVGHGTTDLDLDPDCERYARDRWESELIP